MTRIGQTLCDRSQCPLVACITTKTGTTELRLQEQRVYHVQMYQYFVSYVREVKTAIWRYNTIVHMGLNHEQQHPQLRNTYTLPKIPASMLLKSYISVKEEQAMRRIWDDEE
jgi:hypothetical protein